MANVAVASGTVGAGINGHSGSADDDDAVDNATGVRRLNARLPAESGITEGRDARHGEREREEGKPHILSDLIDNCQLAKCGNLRIVTSSLTSKRYGFIKKPDARR